MCLEMSAMQGYRQGWEGVTVGGSGLSLTTVEPVCNGHPWDHAKWLLNRSGLLIEVGGAL